MKVFTVTPIKIFKFKDGTLSRSIPRIESHILSLKSQKTSAEIKTIISDMSTDQDIINKLSAICKKHNAIYINTVSNLIFNKSLCLNIGIKMSQDADYIATMDADIIIRDDVIEKCIENKTKDNVILCQAFMYNKEHWDGDFSKESFDKMSNHGKFLSKDGNGGIQFFEKDWLFKVNGYDERYNLRGGMDNEMIVRFSLNKGSEHWLNKDDEILIAHLDHERFNFLGVTREYVSKYRTENNVALYNVLRAQRGNPNVSPSHIIVNSKSWGIEKNVIGPRLIDGKVKIC